MTPFEIEPSTDDSRRTFLKNMGLVAGPAAAALLMSGTAQAAKPSKAKPVPQFRLPDLYPGWNARNFQEIQKDENAHVPAIIAYIQSLGGTPRPRPNFRNLTVPTNNLQLFVGLANVLENTGSSAYLGAAPVIFSKTTLATALSIAEVESYHSGYLNTVINFPIVPNNSSFSTPFTIAQVISNASYFLDANDPNALNGGPPLSFDTQNPSVENDIAILNFALALEYLEQEYYNINVPVFYGA